MCVNCALQSFEAGASAGGATGVQALAAAGFATVGMRSVSAWLVAHEFTWVTPRRVKAATSLLVMVALTVVVQMSLSEPPL
jgi:hypothetical protein